MNTPILGSAYVARSVNAACDRMINLFPEILSTTGAKSRVYLQRTPGLTLEFTCGDGPIRGIWTLNSYNYVVSGSNFYKIDADYNITLLGEVLGESPVSIADNGVQIMLATNPRGYIYNTRTFEFVAITDVDFEGAVTVGYLDGYFVFNQPGSQKIWVCVLLDGTQIEPLDFASAEASPDLVQCVICSRKEAWIFGTNSIEVWYNAGIEGFPLAPIQGAFSQIGTTSSYSACRLDNTIFFLGQDQYGVGVVYKVIGYQPVRISTHTVEWQIQEYPNIGDAIGYTYQQDGHSFYVLNFPSANRTWVYDVTTEAWHERAAFNNGNFERHWGNNQAVFNNKILIGDYQNGNVYSYDLNNYTDHGQVQKCLRSWRALDTGTNNLKRTAQHVLQLDCETGTAALGLTPQMMLRWSDDAGHTYSPIYATSMGRTGEYGTRVIWRRLGITNKLRDRVYEISITDPVKIAIMGAELSVSGTIA